MHEHAANADGLGRVEDPVGGILEQGATETVALVGSLDGQSCQHDDGDRVRHVALEAPRGRVGRHCAGCQCVVRDDQPFIADDESA